MLLPKALGSITPCISELRWPLAYELVIPVSTFFTWIYELSVSLSVHTHTYTQIYTHIYQWHWQMSHPDNHDNLLSRYSTQLYPERLLVNNANWECPAIKPWTYPYRTSISTTVHSHKLTSIADQSQISFLLSRLDPWFLSNTTLSLSITWHWPSRPNPCGPLT